MFNALMSAVWGEDGQDPALKSQIQRSDPSALIASAFQYGIYGIALWDETFNLIAANRQYADLHKIPEALTQSGTHVSTIMQNLKDRNVLSADTDIQYLFDYLTDALNKKGHLTSTVTFADGTVLEISAERMPNGFTATFLRNATRDKMQLNALQLDAAKSDAYVDAILKFPSIPENSSRRALAAQLDEITRTIATLMKIDWCVIWVRSSVINQAVSASSYRAATGAHIEPETMQLPNLAGYLAILETSQVIAIDDVEKHAFGKFQGNRAPLDEHAYASLDTPFRQNGPIVGVLSCLDTHNARNWTAADKMFALSAASHIGNLLSAAEENALWDLPTREIDSNRQAAE